MQTPPAELLQAGIGMYGSYFPGLTPTSFLQALRNASNKTIQKNYSLKQTADITELSVDTLKREIHRGNLKAKKLGSQWRITDISLREYLEGGVE